MPFGAIQFGDTMLVKLTKLYFSEKILSHSLCLVCFGSGCSSPIKSTFCWYCFTCLKAGRKLGLSTLFCSPASDIEFTTHYQWRKIGVVFFCLLVIKLWLNYFTDQILKIIVYSESLSIDWLGISRWALWIFIFVFYVTLEIRGSWGSETWCICEYTLYASLLKSGVKCSLSFGSHVICFFFQQWETNGCRSWSSVLSRNTFLRLESWHSS